MARILIVEDDESIRNLIELTLMQFQYETVSFEDAETAWEYLKKNSADMGIFDLMLPGMTGLELIARIREDEHLSGLPVIILTAKDSELDKVIGLDQGADETAEPECVEIIHTYTSICSMTTPWAIPGILSPSLKLTLERRAPVGTKRIRFQSPDTTFGRI